MHLEVYQYTKMHVRYLSPSLPQSLSLSPPAISSFLSTAADRALRRHHRSPCRNRMSAAESSITPMAPPPPNAPLRLRGGCGLWGYGEQRLWLCGGELFHGLAEVAADEDVVEDATFGCRSGGAGRDCSSCKFTIGTLTTWILQGRWCFGFGNGGGGGA